MRVLYRDQRQRGAYGGGYRAAGALAGDALSGVNEQ
jgi:hypothetical protein